MSLPRVSILMPVRNEERYLPAALDSIFRQTLTEWELVAVDDGSTDGTLSILSEAAHIDSRIHIIRREGGGLVAALNDGLSCCHAPMLARMDGDDICHPKRLELQAAYLDANPECGLVACSFRHFPRTGLKQGMLAYETWQNKLITHNLIMRDQYVESPFVHPSIMTLRKIIERIGGYHDCGWAEDYDLWLRMATEGVQFARLPQNLFFWRDHPERATRTMSEYSAVSFRECKAHFLRQSFLFNHKNVIIAGAGLEGRAWHRVIAAHGINVSTWLDVDPRKLGRILHGATIIHPMAYKPRFGDKMIVAIGVRGAREDFRTLITTMGFREGLDFVCVA
jgi:glycosyltransferase involved in cell wall biosynthesis